MFCHEGFGGFAFFLGIQASRTKTGLFLSQHNVFSGISMHGLLLQASRERPEIIAYSDADWAACLDTGHSTSGYAIFLGPNLISWRSIKQPTLHVRSVLFELGFPVRDPTTLYCDNISASYLSVNPIHHARSKHINIDYHFVRERVAHGDLRV
ncbi:unnamed protein product [Cuscuta europaea]|uniref:Retrovirus-related Pol polyprotein from transposon RE1 n=1 Tax=Cuscuta europaea TaxID=41803 RepID=A0A9P1EJR3_CUSEU|nr:unnamed protein product [Cuscuta europaea]